MKNTFLTLIVVLLGASVVLHAQSVTSAHDNFEGSGSITGWFGDDCAVDTAFPNPFQEDLNTSNTVMEYRDVGGQYANVRFQMDQNFDLTRRQVFSLKIYVPADGLTGNQSNQVSFKLQDGRVERPWETQSEIIKPIELGQWQTVRFDFGTDNFINLDPNSLPPTRRNDFNRVVIQVNGENNNDHVLAYIDDVSYEETIIDDPIYNNLVWSDEFEGDGAVDATKWFHQTRLPAGGSWFNGEIQHYTDRLENTYLDNGILKIVAKKERFTDQGEAKDYTSARLNSKFAFQYGRVEIRAKLPSGVGTWPALWMLGQNITENGAYWQTQGFGTTGWPACGEIDIMEHWGNNQDYVQSATHTPFSHGATVNHGGRSIAGVSDNFHVYGLEWSPEKLVFTVDGIVHYTYNPEEKNADTWPFDAPQYFIFNIAIQPSITPSFSSSAMEVDYIRVYQEGVTSTEEVPTHEFAEIYPNPVLDALYVELESTTGKEVLLRLYRMDGQLIKTFRRATQQTIKLENLGNLPSGAYILDVEMNDKRQRLQFVKA